MNHLELLNCYSHFLELSILLKTSFIKLALLSASVPPLFLLLLYIFYPHFTHHHLLFLYFFSKSHTFYMTIKCRYSQGLVLGTLRLPYFAP